MDDQDVATVLLPGQEPSLGRPLPMRVESARKSDMWWAMIPVGATKNPVLYDLVYDVRAVAWPSRYWCPAWLHGWGHHFQ